MADHPYPLRQRFQPRRSGPQTLQDQLVAFLRSAVAGGTLRPGERLPASRMLAAELGVSRNTVIVAYERLLAEGYLEARRGAGTFVAPGLPMPAPEPAGEAAEAPSRRRPARRAAAVREHVSPLVSGNPPGPMTPGLPALDAFPFELWGRLSARYWRRRRATELAYTDPAGIPELRQALSHYLRAYRGVLCEPEQVIVVGGSQAGIDITARVLLEPGERVWVENPGYGACQKALLGADARLAPVPVDAEGLDVGAGEREAAEARLAFVAPAHQYPTGAVMSLERRLQLLEWAERQAAWVLEDDYDGEFRYGRAPISTLHALDRSARVIYLGTLSKVLAPGLRIGYLVVPQDLASTFTAMKAAVDRQAPIGDQAVVADFIASGHLAAHVRRLRGLYGRRRQAVLGALRRRLGQRLRIVDTGAGLHFLAHLTAPSASDADIAAEAARRGLGVRPLSTASPLGAASQGLIIGFANVAEGAAAEMVERLADALDAAGRPARSGGPGAIPRRGGLGTEWR